MIRFWDDGESLILASSTFNARSMIVQSLTDLDGKLRILLEDAMILVFQGVGAGKHTRNQG
jgi:hypothetical protein